MKSFTIIETIVALFVLALIMGVVGGFIVMIYDVHGYTWQQSIAIDDARRWTEIMTAEIREARTGDNGAYPIEKAGDKEIIFYSDIDNDNETERVRYFLGIVGSGSETKECQTSFNGGICNVVFSNFLTGTIISAEVKVSVNGDFGTNKEYAEIFADGIKLSDVCKTGCNDCPGETWQGTTTFDVTSQADDDYIDFLADATNWVDPRCPHSMKARFEFSFTEDLSAFAHEFKKGVIEPVVGSGGKIEYPLEEEKVSTVSFYIRNVPPIFEYYNRDWPEDTTNNPLPAPARLQETKLMKVYLVINVEPNRPPKEFELESFVQLRNLKTE